MRRFASFVSLMIFMVMMVLTVPGFGDFYVKVNIHTDTFYNYGTIQPASDQVEEYWISDKKMTRISENRTLIIDLESNRFIFVNRRAKTYVETPLPLNPDAFADERLAGAIKHFSGSGDATAAGEVKKIDKWNCKAYKLTEWRTSKDNAKEILTWAATDTGVNLETYNGLYSHILKFEGFDDNYIEKRKIIGGFEVYAETTRFVRGQKATSNRKVVELVKKEPPKGVYGVPEGFTKKEKLTVQDFR